jgi:hypothetical protein
MPSLLIHGCTALGLLTSWYDIRGTRMIYTGAASEAVPLHFGCVLDGTYLEAQSALFVPFLKTKLTALVARRTAQDDRFQPMQRRRDY